MKKLLGIAILSLLLSINANAISKKEFNQYCPQYMNEAFEEQNIEVTNEIAKKIKKGCKCQKKAFSTIPDDHWSSFSDEKKAEIFSQAALGCVGGKI